MESIGEETCFDHEGSTFKCHRCRDIPIVDAISRPSLGQQEPNLFLPPPKCPYPSSGRFLAFLYNL